MESSKASGSVRILYAKSRVAVHPTPYAAHNQVGFLTLLQRAPGGNGGSIANEASSSLPTLAQRNQQDILLAWIPEVMAKQRGDVAKLIEVELREAEGLRSNDDKGSDDSILIDSVPTASNSTAPPGGESSMTLPPFCQSLGSIYSICITPPTVSNWNSSLIVNLVGGETLPTLYFHDDESRKTALGIHRASSTALSSSPSSSLSNVIENQAAGSPSAAQLSTSPPAATAAPGPAPAPAPSSSIWGGDELVQHLRKYAVVHRSVHDQRTFLLNPQAADLEAHSTPVWADDAIDEPPAAASSSSAFDAVFPDDPFSPTYPTRFGGTGRRFGDGGGSSHASSQPGQGGESFSSWAKATRMSLLSQFSHVTRSARDVSRQVIEQLPAHHQQAAHRFVGRTPAAAPTFAQAGPLGPFGAAPPASSSSSSSLSSTAAAANAEDVAEKAGVAEYDSARLYLAKWARLVAEEGERNRKRTAMEQEQQQKSVHDALGAWEMLDHPDAARFRPVRRYDPITAAEWEQWSRGGPQGRPTVSWRHAKREVYKRGLAPSARPDAWPALLNVVPWGTDDEEREKTWERREDGWRKLRGLWIAGEEGQGEPPSASSTDSSFDTNTGSEEAHMVEEMACKLSRRPDVQEQQHRIRVDVLRTDRKLPLFKGSAAGEERRATTPTIEAGQASPYNPHFARLEEVLMTYTLYDTLFVGQSRRWSHSQQATPSGSSPSSTASSVKSTGTASTTSGPQPSKDASRSSTLDDCPPSLDLDLPSLYPPRQLARLAQSKFISQSELGGYVQGMSDLCATVYSVLAPQHPSHSCAAFWCFTALMSRIRSNFLSSQQGIKSQLLALQVLLRRMDGGLYGHLERTGSLNLFFCFRWLLVRFKREFDLEGVARLWEAGWALEPGVHQEHGVQDHDDQAGDQGQVPSTRHHHLFICLAILLEHRDAVVGHLRAFDEVLAFYQSLSGSIDVEDTLLRAERLLRRVGETLAEQGQEGEGRGEEGKTKGMTSEEDLHELRRLIE
ncbi:hypothetical protein BDZ90DRAFT_231824 [Jaminaea rosea]|uniref:Rab-GAP TBC domain-containing protein n=1 Tax=Jaminaea rosea TaxID=1569628 RepID=A0A316UVV9_9BASI|nr:hypothetical protein BDZ90DRAFT_231824 [Jaminaea rosea]PWN28063.1 hypothetical protein BDZ90DRAFT_231824 [Jaminaea rosea]